jgi:hypothetical protein
VAANASSPNRNNRNILVNLRHLIVQAIVFNRHCLQSPLSSIAKAIVFNRHCLIA